MSDDTNASADADAVQAAGAPPLFPGGQIGPAKRRERPGRNEPCWCESGKKYKRCHADADERGERDQLESVRGDAQGFAIAEALIEIGGEELAGLDATQERARVLDLVALAWNLDVLEEIGDADGRADLLSALSDGPERAALDEVIEEMVARKQEQFPGEVRLVMKVMVGDDGEVRVISAAPGTVG